MAYEHLEDSLLCPAGMLERGDVIRYKKYGKEMEAFFVGTKPKENNIVIRKTANTHDNIGVEDIIEKVEDPDIRMGAMP